MSKRRPIKLSTTFLVFFPNHLFLPECGWVSYCMEWEEYGQKNSNWAENHFFWKMCSDFLGKENAQKRMPFCYASTFFSFSSRFGSSWSFSCFFHFHVFWLLASFFPWMGGRFCSAGDWVVFLTFLELLVHFPFMFLEFSCVFTMAGKSHSCFWLSHWLLVSRTDYLGCFSLLWVVLTDKLQDCVFPHVVSRFCCYIWGRVILFPV